MMTNSFLEYISELQADDDIPTWSGYMPDKRLVTQTGSIRFYDLHPVLRALLIADGTVTMALEAIYREPVVVTTLAQGVITVANDILLLDVTAGDDVFFRRVQLRGADSDKVYVEAYSLLRQHVLDSALWAQLQSEEIGMGVVLRNAGKSSFREVLHIGGGNLVGEDGFVHRSYRVQLDMLPAILITEVFDLNAFASGYK